MFFLLLLSCVCRLVCLLHGMVVYVRGGMHGKIGSNVLVLLL